MKGRSKAGVTTTSPTRQRTPGSTSSTFSAGGQEAGTGSCGWPRPLPLPDIRVGGVDDGLAVEGVGEDVAVSDFASHGSPRALEPTSVEQLLLLDLFPGRRAPATQVPVTRRLGVVEGLAPPQGACDP